VEYYLESYLDCGRTAPGEFQRALRKGRSQAFFSRITRRPCHLLLFETIKEKFNLVNRVDRGRQEIQLDQIIGSVGKHELFTQSLLPLANSLEDRWKNIYVLMLGPCGCPPIKVYKVRDGYFILDGHHRASVARYLGNQMIEAYVTEWTVAHFSLQPRNHPRRGSLPYVIDKGEIFQSGPEQVFEIAATVTKYDLLGDYSPKSTTSL
jgi:hypothetical protein